MTAVQNNNSFTWISYNLGAADSDHEILLSSFEEKLNDAQKAIWKPESLIKRGEKTLAEGNFTSELLTKAKLAPEQVEAYENSQDKNNTIELFKKQIPSFKQSLKDAIENSIPENIAKASEEYYMTVGAFELVLQDHLLLDKDPIDAVDIKNYHASDDKISYVKSLISKYPEINTYRGWGSKAILSVLKDRAEARASNLILEQQKPDVVLLQEIGDRNRTFVKLFENASYHFFPQNPIMTGILLKKERFETKGTYVIKTTDERESTAILAKDRITHKAYLFVSAHIPGCDYELTGASLIESARKGNAHSQQLLLEIKKIEAEVAEKKYPLDAILIGADVNASPEKLPSRFDLFYSWGFKAKRTGSPTNVHFIDSQDQVREIDFLFVKITQTFFAKIRSLFSGDRINIVAHSFPTFGFDMKNNMSDHKPIMGTVSVIKYDYIEDIKKLFQRIKNCFSRRFNSGRTSASS